MISLQKKPKVVLPKAAQSYGFGSWVYLVFKHLKNMLLARHRCNVELEALMQKHEQMTGTRQS
jgi:hypothetical protein